MRTCANIFQGNQQWLEAAPAAALPLQDHKRPLESQDTEPDSAVALHCVVWGAGCCSRRQCIAQWPFAGETWWLLGFGMSANM
jgi:hypothetical protein